MRLSTVVALATLVSLALASCQSKDHFYARKTAIEPRMEVGPTTGPIGGSEEGFGPGDGPGIGGDTFAKNGGLGDGFQADDGTSNFGQSPYGAPVEHGVEPIYFGFDSAAVRSEDHGKVAAIVGMMQANASYVLVLGGHCDERGTEEYNRTLSEKRALAVQEIVLQVDPSLAGRVHTQGYGEEKPARSGSTEDSFMYNRRSEFELYDSSKK